MYLYWTFWLAVAFLLNCFLYLDSIDDGEAHDAKFIARHGTAVKLSAPILSPSHAIHHRQNPSRILFADKVQDTVQRPPTVLAGLL